MNCAIVLILMFFQFGFGPANENMDLCSQFQNAKTVNEIQRIGKKILIERVFPNMSPDANLYTDAYIRHVAEKGGPCPGSFPHLVALPPVYEWAEGAPMGNDAVPLNTPSEVRQDIREGKVFKSGTALYLLPDYFMPSMDIRAEVEADQANITSSPVTSWSQLLVMGGLVIILGGLGLVYFMRKRVENVQ